MAVTIAVETPLQDDVRAMVADLNATMIPLTPREFQFQLTVEQMADPSLTTFVARDENGRHVGMASLKDHGEGLGEVKRMFTLPAVRGQRVGSQLLQRIEQLAREKRISQLVLETGEAAGFEAAYRVYERGGFTVCGAVLDYPDSGFSRFYEKKISLMSDLTRLTIAEARQKLRAKEIKATEIADAYIGAIEAANPAINAYIVTTPEKARDMAKASDAKLAKGEGGALEGIPLGIKDLFATEGVHTQACSHVLDGFKPRYESTVTSNLWADGAVMLGKLNMDEFAMGSSNETSYYGAVINPWRAQGSNADLVPGGSSGGSAAAVSAWLCAGATATDTGGSIRQPAAFTGTVGIKPTYGRCSRWGIAAFASSLDQAGPIARDVRDAAILLKSMASVDAKDTTSVDIPVPDYEAALGKSVKGMKVGIPKEYRVDGMPDEIEALWQKGIAWLKDAGAEIVDISLPHTKYALPAYYIVAPAEASSNLARYDGVRYGLRVPGKDIVEMYENTRAAGFGREVKRRIMIGTYVLSAGYYDAYYLQAQKVRTLIKRDFELAFDAGVDVILTPATPSAAFGVADQDMAADPVKMYLNDIFTVTVNMAGLPGIAVPAGLDAKGLPLGLQLIGKPFEEETLFQAGHVIEQAAGRFQPEKWW